MATVAAIAFQVQPSSGEPRHSSCFTRRPDHSARSVEIDATNLPVCPELRSTPLGPCPQVVRVPVASGEPYSLLDGRRLQIERETAERVAREIEAGARHHHFPRDGIRMFHGIEPEPVRQVQLKREIFVALAKVTGDSRIMRVAAGISAGWSIRAFADADALERTRERATYIEIERFKGPSARSMMGPDQIPYASAGFSLLGLASVARPLIRAVLGDTDGWGIHPRPWPPGLLIEGRFR